MNAKSVSVVCYKYFMSTKMEFLRLTNSVKTQCDMNIYLEKYENCTVCQCSVQSIHCNYISVKVRKIRTNTNHGELLRYTDDVRCKK